MFLALTTVTAQYATRAVYNKYRKTIAGAVCLQTRTAANQKVVSEYSHTRLGPCRDKIIRLVSCI